MRAYSTVQQLLCHGGYCELVLSLARTLCRLLFTVRPTARPLAGNPLRDVFVQEIRPNPRYLMTRSPLRCCTSIIRSFALVQASSSLFIAWPRRLPVTEIHFRHFSREFVLSARVNQLTASGHLQPVVPSPLFHLGGSSARGYGGPFDLRPLYNMGPPPRVMPTVPSFLAHMMDSAPAGFSYVGTSLDHSPIWLPDVDAARLHTAPSAWGPVPACQLGRGWKRRANGGVGMLGPAGLLS